MSSTEYEKTAGEADFTEAGAPGTAPLIRQLSDMSSIALGQLRSYLEQNPFSIPVERIRGSFAIAVPTGAVINYAAATPPQGWLVCDGSAISRATFVDLFQVIGTTFGVGDGSTTFNLPDMTNRVAVGLGTGTFGALNNAGGAETFAVTLGTANLPAHQHGVTVAAHLHSNGTLVATSHTHPVTGAPAVGSLAVGSHSHGGATGNAAPTTDNPGNHGHSSRGDLAITNFIAQVAAGAAFAAVNGQGDAGVGLGGAHSHTVSSHSHSVSAEAPAVSGAPGLGTLATSGTAPGVTGNTGNTTPTASSSNTGTDTPFNVGVLQPFRTLQSIIKT
jgi:microcystin-dependent protein